MDFNHKNNQPKQAKAIGIIKNNKATLSANSSNNLDKGFLLEEQTNNIKTLGAKIDDILNANHSNKKQPSGIEHNQIHVVVGIDVGTSNTTLAYKTNINDQIQVWINPYTKKNFTETFLGIKEEGKNKKYVYGTVAKTYISASSPLKTKSYVWSNWKRDIGNEVASKKYKNNPYLTSPEAVLTQYLIALKADFEKSVAKIYGQLPSMMKFHYVISSPADFNYYQKAKWLACFHEAKMDVIAHIPEPMGVGIYYFNKKEYQEQFKLTLGTHNKWLVVDVGGGTTDVATIEYNKGIVDTLPINYFNLFGGVNIDHLLTKYIISLINQNNKQEWTPRYHLYIDGISQQIKEQISLYGLKYDQAKDVKWLTQPFYIKLNHLQHSFLPWSHCFTLEWWQKEFAPTWTPRIIYPISETIKAIKQKHHHLFEGIILTGGGSMIDGVKRSIANQYPTATIIHDNAYKLATCIGTTMYGYELIYKNIKKFRPASFKIPQTISLCTLDRLGHRFYKPIIRVGSEIPATGEIKITNHEDFQKDLQLTFVLGENYLNQTPTVLGHMIVDLNTPDFKGKNTLLLKLTVDIHNVIHAEVKDLQNRNVKATRIALNPENISIVENNQQLMMNSNHLNQEMMEKEDLAQYQKWFKNIRKKLMTIGKTKNQEMRIYLDTIDEYLEQFNQAKEFKDKQKHYFKVKKIVSGWCLTEDLE